MRAKKVAYPGGHFPRLHLQGESLELREMLATVFHDEIDLGIFPENHADSDDVEISLSNDSGTGDIPVIPFDDSLPQFRNCPGLPPELCLPGDLDSNQSVDFADFLRLSTNYGLEDALWEDGDLTGDGIVSLADFLILSNNFGKSA